MSNAGDGARRGGNAVGKVLPALAWGVGSAVGGFAGSIASKSAGTFLMSRLFGGKGVSGISSISKLLKGTK
ncbi:hypothetical protein LGL73_14445, partial [Staphylococcus aureus]|uniref:hypothetical protein n=1 Tax=Staphylococcus aureus TaxID=1280 RepID=UPI0039A73C66|nr:hypothetical protein [Staphylococcus aureus]